MPKFLILLSLALTAHAQMQERVAIINTLDTRDSVSITDLAYLTDRLRETAVKILPKDRYGVMTTESIVAFLGSMENTVKVCKAASCLAELGRMVSADYVAQGNIGRFGNDLTIKVELYSVKNGILMDSFTGYSKDVYGLLTLVDEKAPDMFKNMLATTPPPEPVTTTPPPPTPVTPSVKPVIIYDGNNISIQEYVQILIERDIENTKEDIQKQSLHLSPYDKSLLYHNNKMEHAAIWAYLNTLGGLGSYLQGDIKFGVIQSGLFVLFIGSTSKPSYKDVGIAAVGISIIIGLIRPFVYRSSYNKALREALNIEENISYSIDPLIIPKAGPPAVGLAFNVRY